MTTSASDAVFLLFFDLIAELSDVQAKAAEKHAELDYRESAARREAMSKNLTRLRELILQSIREHGRKATVTPLRPTATPGSREPGPYSDKGDGCEP